MPKTMDRSTLEWATSTVGLDGFMVWEVEGC